MGPLYRTECRFRHCNPGVSCLSSVKYPLASIQSFNSFQSNLSFSTRRRFPYIALPSECRLVLELNVTQVSSGSISRWKSSLLDHPIFSPAHFASELGRSSIVASNTCTCWSSRLFSSGSSATIVQNDACRCTIIVGGKRKSGLLLMYTAEKHSYTCTLHVSSVRVMYILAWMFSSPPRQAKLRESRWWNTWRSVERQKCRDEGVSPTKIHDVILSRRSISKPKKRWSWKSVLLRCVKLYPNFYTINCMKYTQANMIRRNIDRLDQFPNFQSMSIVLPSLILSSNTIPRHLIKGCSRFST